MIRIGLVGLPYDDNLGDPLMIECVKRICEKQFASNSNDDFEFEMIDLMARENNEEIPYKRSLGYYYYKFKKKLTRDERKYQSYEIKAFDKGKYQLFEVYYKEKLQKVDFIIIVGGALITYRYNRNFHSPIHLLISTAEKMNKQVLINSVGIENGYDLTFESCRLVKEFLNKDNVIAISTRDDIDTLRKYVDNSKEIALTADSALFVESLFNVSSPKDTISLGIGIIAPEKFDQYSDDSYSKNYVVLIRSLIKSCLGKKINFKLFTNGHIKDYNFGIQLLQEFNLDTSYIVERPKNYHNLISDIAQFDKIVTSRLHSCIIAYGFEIPFFGIDWNGKLSFFADVTKRSDYVTRPLSKIDSEYVLNRIFAFDKDYYKSKNVMSYKQTEEVFLAKNLKRMIGIL